jgi:hypothetical protein
MFDSKIIALAETQIRTVLLQMPTPFTSHQFISAFSGAYPAKHAAIVQLYINPRTDERHATQRAHVMLMHTINHKLNRIARKVQTIPNPNGGTMSLWQKD